MHDISDYDLCIRRCPTLTAYLLRVNAWPRNFRTFVVEQDDATAYTGRRAVAKIKLAPDGTIECANAEYAPTEAETAAIKIEVAATNFPRSITATVSQTEDLIERLGSDAQLFIFRAPNSNETLFVQQRVYNERTGKKSDLPWSMWADGQWRMQEPDGMLPLFGQNRMQGMFYMVHEGAKGAAFVQQQVDCNSDWLLNHPWCDELKKHVHIGWPGGTERVFDVDWGPLKKLPPEFVVTFVADHDKKGEATIPKISKLLLRSLRVIKFTDQFPAGFDLADDWPKKKEWWSGHRYVGPSFDDLQQSATWATQAVPVPAQRSRGKPPKPVYRIRAEFAAEWLRVEELKGAMVNRRQTNRILTPENFNQSVKPFSDVGPTGDLLADNWSSHCAGAVYRPGGGRGVIHVNGKGACINLYRPSEVKPLPGDVTPFIDFLTHLVPDANERHQIMRWCATLIACEQVRMLYALLLITEAHGTGKGTLCYILRQLIALWNTSYPTEQEIVDGKYNDWVWQKRLAVVHEIHGGHSWAVANKLKHVITEREVPVSRKYIPNFVDENWLHVVACSNSLKPLSMEDPDRRWLVPRCTELLKPTQYWRELRHWLNSDGIGIIKRWALEFKDYVEEGEHAPPTAAKLNIIAESRSLMARFAFDTGQLVAALGNDSPPRRVVLSVNDVHLFAQNRYEIRDRDRDFQKPLVIRKALLAAGLHEIRRHDAPDPRFMVGGQMTSVVANFMPAEPVRNWEQIVTYWAKTEEFWSL